MNLFSHIHTGYFRFIRYLCSRKEGTEASATDNRRTDSPTARQTKKRTMQYNDFGTWLYSQLGQKVQKISINAGFTCPNRDGTVGTGGCTYCNNQTFNPEYCRTDKSITQQLTEGKDFFRKKYPAMKYLAYFQAYTNTYGSLDSLKAKYEEALAVEDVVGLVIGTRPDCMPESLLDYLQELHDSGVFILVEYGIESCNDLTLRRINRGHDHRCTCDAVRRTAARGIPIGGHIILGLPGETADDMLATARRLSSQFSTNKTIEKKLL